MDYQGTNAANAFHGKGKSNAIKLFYADSAPLFAKIIQNNCKPGTYTLADLGGHKGEFLKDIINLLTDYSFTAKIVDRVEGLEENVKAEKYVGDIINSPLPDKSIDIVIMRYVLPWDAYERQKSIVAEVQRICRGFAIIQHQGAPRQNPEPLEKSSLKLWSGTIPALKRDYGFFTNAAQVEIWMKELGINASIVEEKYIETLSEMFIEKFNLNATDAEKTKAILAGCDGITVTTWLLRF